MFDGKADHSENAAVVTARVGIGEPIFNVVSIKLEEMRRGNAGLGATLPPPLIRDLALHL